MIDTYQQTGIKEFGDLELKDFKWQLIEFSYNCVTMTSYAIIEAWELNQKHRRLFEISDPQGNAESDVITEVLKLETFNGSTLI